MCRHVSVGILYPLVDLYHVTCVDMWVWACCTHAYITVHIPVCLWCECVHTLADMCLHACVISIHTYIRTHAHTHTHTLEAQFNLCTLTLMGTKQEDYSPTRLQREVRGEARKQRSAVDSDGVGRCGSPSPHHPTVSATRTHAHTNRIEKPTKNTCQFITE